MELTSLAKPYANALLAICAEQNNRDKWLSFLNTLSDLSKNDSVMQIIQSPNVGKDKQKAIILSLLKQILGETTNTQQNNLIDLLVKNNRLNIASILYELFDEGSNLNSHHVMVSSAYDLSDKDTILLNEKLTSQYGGDIILKTQTDAKLLGGVVLKQGDRVTDNSIKAKLEKLTTLLTINK